PNPTVANGTEIRESNFSIYGSETIIDHAFLSSTSHVVNESVTNAYHPDNWSVSNAKLTYQDGTVIDVQLRDKKIVREFIDHNGVPNSRHVDSIKYTFDIPNTKDIPAIEDESVFNRSIVTQGDAKHSSEESILGDSSIYFDGNDYLEVPDGYGRYLHSGQNDFTIECWVNVEEWLTDSAGYSNRSYLLGTGGSTGQNGIWFGVINYPGNGFIFRVTRGVAGTVVAGLKSDTTVNLNTWYHVAVTYDSNTYKLFVNGVPVDESAGNHTNHSSGLSYTPFRVGRFSWPGQNGYFKGYIQDLRISSKAVYAGCFRVPSQLHSIKTVEPDHPNCDEVVLSIQSDTNNESDQIEDSSLRDHPVTVLGDTTHSSTQSILGNSSLYFDGAGDYLTIDQTSDLNLNGDFTMECWVYVNSDPANAYGHPTDTHVIASCWHSNASNVNWQLLYTSDYHNRHQTGDGEILYAEYVGSATIAARLPAFLNTWYHVAVVGSGNEISLYLNGVKSTPIQGHNSYNSNLSKKIYIGSREMLHHNNQLYFDGYIQDFRISKKAVYTSCFAVPSQLHSIETVEPDHPTCDEVVLSIQSDTNNESDQIEDSSLRD
ncbi:MAG: LamG domain-containing protein, partial [Candidatus Thermoplasmatota archaeon]|nr:LamG domain-containing protein [Candidatus Thermoplasmatota archaeon]